MFSCHPGSDVDRHGVIQFRRIYNAERSENYSENGLIDGIPAAHPALHSFHARLSSGTSLVQVRVHAMCGRLQNAVLTGCVINGHDPQDDQTPVD